MTAHGRDHLGRVLPDPAWPPGREAPDELEFVRRLLNTRNRENGADRIATPLGLATFLDAQGRDAFLAEPADHARVLAVREALHAMAVRHGDPTEPPPPPPDDAFADVVLGVAATADGLALHVPDHGRVPRLLGGIACTVLDHQRRGDWTRLKACRHCAWVVYDTSRNRSSRWCSMDACGGRHNARAYRARQG